MNKRYAVALAATMTGVLLLPGCGKAAEKIGEKATEKAIESQTGGKVDINSNDGKIKIKTSDGEAEMNLNDSGGYHVKTSDGEMTLGSNAKVPDGWPKALNPPKGASITQSIKSKDSLSIGYTVKGKVSDVASDLDEAAKGDDWKSSSETEINGSKYMDYDRGDDSLSIIVLSDDSLGKGVVSVNMSLQLTSSDTGSSDTASTS